MTEHKKRFAYSAEEVLARFSTQFPKEVRRDPTFLLRTTTCLSYAQHIMLLDDSETLAGSEPRADGYQMLLFNYGRELIEFYTRMKTNITQSVVISLDILRS